MTSRTIPVSAQWALEGKQPDGEDYRILACSNGDLTRANFADALSRFQLGELSDLPQVSVSYARHGTEPGLSYVALAIHWYATEGQRHADGVASATTRAGPPRTPATSVCRTVAWRTPPSATWPCGRRCAPSR